MERAGRCWQKDPRSVRKSPRDLAVLAQSNPVWVALMARLPQGLTKRAPVLLDR
jgi:hypothetical protein